MEYNILDYGAVSDGITMNTVAIQAAIDACTNAGGGSVIVPCGKFLTGTIILKQGVDLHICANAVLLGSPNCEDYPERSDVKHVDSYHLARHRNACLIFAEECENISITGPGTIDCNGTNFVRKIDRHILGWNYMRIKAPTPPRAVFFAGCKNVKIEDVTMINQPSGWSYWIHDCDYVTCDKLKIIADVRYPNNDGIHINSSRNVTISNCSITCGDDCIVVRANNSSLSENKVCERVVVTNCNLTSFANGIRIGWLNDGVIRNCTFSNLVITDSNQGICLELPYRPDDKPFADEGREATLMENLSFDNVIMDSVYQWPLMIVISTCKAVKCDAIRNIYFSNIHARAAQLPWFSGRKQNIIRNIYLNNCTFEKIAEEKLPHYKEGTAEWNTPKDKKLFEYVENIVFNNTAFSEVE